MPQVRKYTYYRITVLMTKEAYDYVIKASRERFRNNRAAAASMLIEKGIKADTL